MRFPPGSVWVYEQNTGPGKRMPDDAEVFVVLDSTSEAAYIRVIDDPKYPHRDGHMQSFRKGGTYWHWSRRVA